MIYSDSIKKGIPKKLQSKVMVNKLIELQHKSSNQPIENFKFKGTQLLRLMSGHRPWNTAQ